MRFGQDKGPLMNAIGGWIGAGGELAESSTLNAMAAAMNPAGVPVTLRTSGTAGLFAVGDPRLACLQERNGVWVALCGHPQWRASKPGQFTLGEIAGHVLERVGPGKFSALEDLTGDFSLALVDIRGGKGAVIAVDAFGIRNLVYTVKEGRLYFASSLDALRRVPTLDLRLAPQALYDYFFYHVVPSPQTIFEGVLRVPAGACVEFSPPGSSRTISYWHYRVAEADKADFGELRTEFLEALRWATDAASRGAASGSFLSGGTDSSTISGMLGRVTGAPARTFSIGFDAAGYDEMDYARVAASHFGTQQHEYYVTPQDVVDATPFIARAYDQPFGNASAVPTFFCARLARDNGIERLLAGDGGDELFGGNERYAKYALLGHYGAIPAPIRRYVVEPLLLGPAATARVPLVRKVRSYVEQARVPMPRRYQSYNLLEHLGPASVFTADFLAAVDTAHPQALMEEAYVPYADVSLINQMLAIDFRFVLTDTDLRKVTHCCELAGVDVAFPMLSAPVVDFSARLPSSMKLRGTQLRWFFKKALTGFLPDEVIRKQKHGFGLPVGTWLTTYAPLYKLAEESLDALRPKGIVQPRFIDELLSNLLKQHPSYYGTMVWLLMVLSQWLDDRRL